MFTLIEIRLVQNELKVIFLTKRIHSHRFL